MKLYLSGPISGVPCEEIADWRKRATAMLPAKVHVYDPASSPYDADLASDTPETPSAALARLMHGRLVVDRNKHMIQSSDVVLANFLHSDRASIGSIGELFWANAFRVPIVIVREESGNVHDHAMLNAIASAVTSSLEDGCEAALNILGTKARVGGRA
jgi:hypothetical protein